jgi:signal transduction histidine kinase
LANSAQSETSAARTSNQGPFQVDAAYGLDYAHGFDFAQPSLDLWDSCESAYVSSSLAVRAFRNEVTFIQGDGCFEMNIRTAGADRDRLRCLSFDAAPVIVDPRDEAQVSLLWWNARAQPQPFNADCRLVRPGCASQWYRLNALPKVRRDSSLYWSPTCINIDDLKRDESSLGRDHEFQGSDGGVTTTSTALSMSQAAGFLAHELNQPLAAALLYAHAASLSLTAPLTSKRQAIAAHATAEAVKHIVHAGDIVRSIKEFIISGECHGEWRDLIPIIKTAMDAALLGVEHIVPSLRLTGKNVAPVFCNTVQMQQVVTNIVRNAVEAMDSMADARLDVIVDFTPSEVIISIADTGPGVSSLVANRLFTSSLTTKAGGMGMGLLVCRAIVERHGGRIWVEAGQFRGTVFKVSLRIGHQDDDRA